MAQIQRKIVPNAHTTQQRRGKYKLDELDALRIAKYLVMFSPTESVIEELVAKAQASIPGLAQATEVVNIVRYNSECVLALARKSKFDVAAPVGEGFIAMLPLNRLGLELLRLEALDTQNPNVKFLAKSDERPAAIYWWGVYAPGQLAAGMALFMEKLSAPQYAGLDIYARPVTDEGQQFLQVLGFNKDLKMSMASNMWVFSRTPQLPLYDSYVPNSGRKELGITVARTFEDLSRVIAIRSAVYIGEQECPYDEEYDGNDLAATHLIAYIGDEPAGCIRARFFADFAKLERLAIRKEFRKSRAAFQLVRAALNLCQKKGYRRAYGHSQVRLEGFWSRFGFHTFEGGKSFVFSDFDYVEMVAEIEPDADAVKIGADPYVIIRPEGRWHKPGILEQSAGRAVTRPSVNKGH